MPIPEILSYALTLAVYLKYPLIFLGTPIGGPALILASGFLLQQGHLSLVPLFISLACGELLLDSLWYYLGYHHADTFIKRFGKYFSVTPSVFSKVKEIFSRYDVRILFISKIMMGFGLIVAILITAGAARIPFKKYIIVNALGEVVWLSIMLAIGYFFGSLYSTIAKGFEIAFLLSTIFACALIFYGASRYGKQAFLKL